MGGTTGGPKDLPAAPAADVNALGDGPALSLPPDLSGGLTPDFAATAPEPLALELPSLTGSIGPGRDNFPEDVWGASSIMAANGLMDAPTIEAGPAFNQGVTSAQELLGATSIDGFSLKGGETEKLVQNVLQKGQINLPARGLTPLPEAASPTSRPLAPPTVPSLLAAEASRPGQSQAAQARTARKVQDAAAQSVTANKPPQQSIPRPTPPKPGVLGLPQSSEAAATKPPAPAKSPAPAKPQLDPVKAASEFRHIATFKLGTFDRDGAGAPTLQGGKLDPAKAQLMERALKARDANDLAAFEAMLGKKGNSLSGPEKAFMRAVAENRFEDTTDAEFEALATDGVNLMAQTPAAAPGKPDLDTLMARQPAYTEQDILNQAPTDIEAAQQQINAAGGNGKLELAASTHPNSAPTPPVSVGTPVLPGPPKTPPQVPLYRNQVIARQGNEWPKQHEAFSRLKGISYSEHFAYMETFAAEGGSDVNTSNGATAGITQSTLDDLIDRGKIIGIPKGTAPKLLKRDERAQVYRVYMDDALNHVGGSQALRDLTDAYAAAALGDTLFRHGRTGGGEIVQRAINRAVPPAPPD